MTEIEDIETKVQSSTTKCEYKVFVVEDSDVYRTLIVENISRIKKANSKGLPNYELFPFSSGEECLENLHLKPDVVIIDYHLDGNGYVKNMDGMTLLKTLKQQSPETAIIVLSCQSDTKIIKDLLRQGASDYIKKDNISQIKVSALVEKHIQIKEIRSKKIKMLKYGLAIFLFIVAFITLIYLW